MKENQTVNKRPLMYISQPKFQPATLNIQQFISVKARPTTQITDEKIIKHDETDLAADLEQHQGANLEQTKIKKRKRFKELAIEEKVNFFIQLPVNVPKSTCEIKTEEKSYIGKIVSFVEGVVTVRTLKEPFKVELPINYITSIQIISLG